RLRGFPRSSDRPGNGAEGAAGYFDPGIRFDRSVYLVVTADLQRLQSGARDRPAGRAGADRGDPDKTALYHPDASAGHLTSAWFVGPSPVGKTSEKILTHAARDLFLDSQ